MAKKYKVIYKSWRHIEYFFTDEEFNEFFESRKNSIESVTVGK